MYLPNSFQVTDSEQLTDVIRRFSFATLITTLDGVPFATHLPVLHRVQPGTAGVLVGHVARANPQWQHFANSTESLAIFSGPHAYVSPSWYETELAVPTWNYIAVHAYGVPRVIDDEAWLVERYESSRPQPWPNQLPEDFRRNLLKSIVGFEMPIARIEGKFKLSQNRPAQDQANVLRELSASSIPESRAVADWMSALAGR
ncbi:MAG: transcriptional regulator [Planctomycetota bacterium]|nr:MAG: transcriptional regulator [Planctomycetota bacterium]